MNSTGYSLLPHTVSGQLETAFSCILFDVDVLPTNRYRVSFSSHLYTLARPLNVPIMVRVAAAINPPSLVFHFVLKYEQIVYPSLLSVVLFRMPQ